MPKICINKPIFISGCLRSGTTLLYELIASQPSLAYPEMALEGMLRHPYTSKLAYNFMPALLLRRMHRIFIPSSGAPKTGIMKDHIGSNLPFEGGFIWKNQLIKNNLSWENLELKHLGDFPDTFNKILSTYRIILKIAGKDRFVDKSPNFTAALPVIHKLFPDAYFIHIIRDGRAVVNSISYAFKYRVNPDGVKFSDMRKWWGPRPPNWKELEKSGPVEKACHQWNYLVRKGLEARQYIGANYCEVRYEDLVSNIRNVMLRIIDHCDLEPSAGIEYPVRLENRNYKWKSPKSREFKDINWTRKPAIEPDEYKYLELMRPLLEELGYVNKNDTLV